MDKILGTSWKTTLVGYLGAVAVAILPILQGQGVQWDKVLLAAIIAVVSRFAKDAGATGVGS
jgi:hypothetical protein